MQAKALIFILTLLTLAGLHPARAALENPSFEKNEAWETLKGHVSFTPDATTPARSGNKVGFVGGWSGGSGEYITQVTDLAVEPGTKYTLSAWFAPRGHADTTYGGSMLRIIAANAQGRFTVALVRDTGIVQDWTRRQLVWQAPDDLSAVPELHGLNGQPTGKTVNVTGATIEVLVGKVIGNGDAYYQTYIDDAKLWKGDEEPPDPEIETAEELLKRDKRVQYPQTDAIKAQDLTLEKLNVHFPSPGRVAYDSMPIGNGETAANVWTQPNGRISFYISRTDAWSGIGRILKVGRVHLEVSPNPFLDSKSFHQELDLQTATVIVSGSNGFEARLWADANAQNLRVKITGDTDFKVKAWTDPWRNKREALSPAERHSAYPMIGGPEEYFTSEPDTIAPANDNQVAWYHRNTLSPYPIHLKVQSLEHLLETTHDPYMHRTFGALMQGPGLQAQNDATLLTPEPIQSFELSVHTHTSQPESAEAWLGEIRQQAAGAKDYASARQAHEAWWAEFWDRSFIHVSGPKPPTFQSAAILRDGRNIMRVGADALGNRLFQGRIARASVFSRNFTPEEIAQLATLREASDLKQIEPTNIFESYAFSALQDGMVANAGSHPGHRPPLKVVGEVELVEDPDFGKVAQLDGDGFFETERQIIQIYTGGTLEAWIRPDHMGEAGGRIFDQAQPGLQLGYYLDTWPNGTGLRANRYDCTNTNINVLQPEKWQHVAMVFDQEHGQVISYVDGEEVGRRSFKDVHLSKETTAPGIFHLNQGYALQRYVNACAGRGNYPIKFNGSIFTMEGVPVRWLASPFNEDADFRMWGPDYWFQNTRLPYWPMLAAGDFDLMDSFFDMYLDTLPMAKNRTETYFGHEGAYWPETITLFGTYNNQNYGWNRDGSLPPGISLNKHIRHYYSGALELLMMMFDRYAITGDEEFAREKILPLATEVIKFYDNHYARDENGILQITPAQALETYNVDHKFVNPAPPVAGLHAIIGRLLEELPEGLASSAALADWRRFREELPPVPYSEELGVLMVAEKKANGAVADRYMHTRGNGECPELYPVFPYRLYALGTEGEAIGRRTFQRLPGYYSGGWNQDAVNAAMVGDTDRAAAFTYWSFATWNDESRFPGFFGPNYDWVPDQDHGGTAMHALQRMLLQEADGKIQLLPAWPKVWDAHFKLHASANTTVEMLVVDGKLKSLQVEPTARKADVVLPDWLGGTRESYSSLPDQYAWDQPARTEARGPQLFFEATDLPAIRQKIQQGRTKEFMEMLRVVANDFMNVQTKPYDSDGPYIGRNLQAQIGALAFVGMIDQNSDHTAKAKEILLEAVRQHDINVYIKANDHLAVGDGGAALAIAYDWLRDELSPAEKEQVKALLRDMVDFLYDSSAHPGPHPYQRAHNHSVVAHNGMLMAAQILGREDIVRYCIPWIRDYLALFQDGSGAPYEGAGYAEYGMIHAFMATEILRRHYGTDLFTEVDGLSRLPRYALQLLQPWDEGLIPIGQTGKSLASAAGLYYVINRLHDPAGLYAWTNVLDEKGIAGFADFGHPSHKSMLPFFVLWTDDSLGTIGPKATGEPLFAQFNRGIVSARSAWGEPNAGLMTFISMKLPHLGIWDHPDENSYTFTAFGDNFIIDPGPHMYNQQGSHNLILLDGAGPNFVGPGHRTEGHLLQAEDRGESVYAAADAADAYRLDSWGKPNALQVEKVLRRILFVRASRPFLVVIDDFEMGDNKPHDFTLRHLFASDASHDYNTLEIDGQKARIIGGRNKSVATLHYLQPAGLTLSQSKVEGTYGKSGSAIDATGATGQSAHYRTLVTSAPRGEAPASVQMQGNTLQVRFPDGERWTVQIEDEDIRASRQ